MNFYPDRPQRYRFLNVDTREFKADKQALLDSLNAGAMLREIPNQIGEILVAAGNTPFTDAFAVHVLRLLVAEEIAA